MRTYRANTGSRSVPAESACGAGDHDVPWVETSMLLQAGAGSYGQAAAMAAYALTGGLPLVDILQPRQRRQRRIPARARMRVSTPAHGGALLVATCGEDPGQLCT